MDLFGARPKFDPVKTEEIRGWIRDLLDLPEDRAILVTQLACMEAGCPPLETVLGVAGAGGGMRQYKFHKSIQELNREDLVSKLKKPKEPH